jgi:hypothetical protein
MLSCWTPWIVLVMDNLYTVSPALLYAAFPPGEAKRIADKLEIHPTPKHGSCLNMPEVEIAVPVPGPQHPRPGDTHSRGSSLGRGAPSHRDHHRLALYDRRRSDQAQAPLLYAVTSSGECRKDGRGWGDVEAGLCSPVGDLELNLQPPTPPRSVARYIHLDMETVVSVRQSPAWQRRADVEHALMANVRTKIGVRVLISADHKTS